MNYKDIIDRLRLPFQDDKELRQSLRDIIGFYPHAIKHYKLALMHKSSGRRNDKGRPLNNERLEFLGDAVLDTVVADFLYATFPDRHEGFLTSTRAKIVQRESLNRIGNTLHLDRHVHALTHAATHNSYICGNALEALVGAIYLDQGYSRCRRFIINRIIKKNFDLNDLVRTEQNFKSRLIEWTQKYRVTIEFELIDSYNDADKNPVFKTAIMLGGIYASAAEGYSKKESHQAASKMAMDRLQNDQRFREQVLATAVI